MEYLAGTRMDDTNSQPQVSGALESGYLHLTMPRVLRPDARLEIQRSTNLFDWSNIGITDFSTFNLLDGGIPTTDGPLGFLRVMAVPGP